MKRRTFLQSAAATLGAFWLPMRSAAALPADPQIEALMALEPGWYRSAVPIPGYTVPVSSKYYHGLPGYNPHSTLVRIPVNPKLREGLARFLMKSMERLAERDIEWGGLLADVLVHDKEAGPQEEAEEPDLPAVFFPQDPHPSFSQRYGYRPMAEQLIELANKEGCPF